MDTLATLAGNARQMAQRRAGVLQCPPCKHAATRESTMKRARTAKRPHATAATTPAAGSTTQLTVSVPVAPPRNPFVALVHGRKAGAHGGGSRRRRQAEKRELRTKLLEE